MPFSVRVAAVRVMAATSSATVGGLVSSSSASTEADQPRGLPSSLPASTGERYAGLPHAACTNRGASGVPALVNPSPGPPRFAHWHVWARSAPSPLSSSPASTRSTQAGQNGAGREPYPLT